MSPERATYLDSSAIVKLAMIEPESVALRHYLRRRHYLVTSAFARTEVVRAVRPSGPLEVERALYVLREFELIRVADRILIAAAQLPPDELRTLDAIHIATAQALGEDLHRLCTYDQRMAEAAAAAGLAVVAPA